MDFYLTKDGFVETREKYAMFLEWCRVEGVVMPKVEYPVQFENGVVGVRCTQDIENREAYMFIPYKMMISLTKIKENKVLGPIIKEYPKSFEKDENADFDPEMLIMTLGVLYEMTKGQKGYWYPYFRLLPDISENSWTDQELDMLQDPFLKFYLKGNQEILFEIWTNFKKVLENHP